VLILAPGMPGSPFKNEILSLFAKKGYWVFLPRYRGTWESGGEFLKESPERDILDVMDGVSKGFTELWSGERMEIKDPEFFLMGASFGGPAVILPSSDPRVRKVVAFSPVIDWRVDSKVEPMDWLEKFVRSAFGEGYRFSKRNWNRLARGKFYNPIDACQKIKGEKVLIIHAQDDDIVPPGPARKFAKCTGCRLEMRKRGGHMGISETLKTSFFEKVNNFFKQG